MPRAAPFLAARGHLSGVKITANQSQAAKREDPVTTNLNINGQTYVVSAVPETPLLWVLRDELKLTGTKYGCGIAQCGACTVHADGQPIRSCQTPISSAASMRITTIEGLGGTHPVQTAWIKHDVPQCGYCQSGQIMSAVALLTGKSKPSDDDIDAAMSGNICRCGTYQRIRAAIHDAAGQPATTGATA
jgi:isoquinoline 1-oxidoreductase alpha subunit